MTNEELLKQIEKREMEVSTQAEFEFDEILSKKFLAGIKTKLDPELLEFLLSSMKFAFTTGARFGFLKYIQNRLEQQK